MDFLQGFLLITCVHLLAAASPGPDFIMVSQQSLSHGRRTGLLCSLGIALGLSVHILYSALGLAAIIASSITLLMLIKIFGGMYLCYLGLQGLRSKPPQQDLEGGEKELQKPVDTFSMQREDKAVNIIGKGILCNVLNPKAPIYFVSLFTLILSPKLPLHYLVLYGLWIMLVQFAWFSFVAMILSSPPVARRFRHYSHHIDRVLGGAMIFLGIKVLMSRTH